MNVTSSISHNPIHLFPHPTWHSQKAGTGLFRNFMPVTYNCMRCHTCTKRSYGNLPHTCACYVCKWSVSRYCIYCVRVCVTLCAYRVCECVYALCKYVCVGVFFTHHMGKVFHHSILILGRVTAFHQGSNVHVIATCEVRYITI